MGKRHDLSGKVFGRLTAISVIEVSVNYATKWRCQCICGNDVIVLAGALNHGTTRSCGCYQKERASQANSRHGKSGTRTHNAWSEMHERCRNVNSKNWVDYGGRGITVSTEWLNFIQFYNDMGDVPIGMSLERIDVNGGYCKDNCCWATPKQQARNRRSSRFLYHDGLNLTIAEWSEMLGIGPSTISARIKRGWSVERALSESLQLPWSKIRLRKAT